MLKLPTRLRTPRIKAVARFATVLLLLVVIIATSLYAGFYKGQNSRAGSSPLSILHPINETGVKVDFSTFWQAWNTINKNFYGDADNTKRLNGAISGMVAGLGDPYTVYFEPSANNLFRSDLDGSFGGIGAELEMKDGLLTIVAALQGTPADKANLKGGDVIVQIDGKKTSDFNYSGAIDKIRGPKGSQVTLILARPGVSDPITVTLTRDTIVVKSVTTSAIGENDSIAYIKVNKFGEDTTNLFKAALQDAKNSSKKGLVVDLRNDPGGYLQSAVDMIGMLIPANPSSSQEVLKKRVAVLERSKDGSEEQQAASTSPILDQLPMVVVVNGGSASASEIFAGAMRDYKRATIIGTQSFGKGSVQTLVDLDNGGSIKVTIAKWFTPLGNGIDKKGIKPDVIIDLPDKTALSTSDAQISKALDLLK